MPRKILITQPQIDWLKRQYGTRPLTHIARDIGCCSDTLKRILMREGLAEFEGAKFIPRKDHAPSLWRRPCMRCKDDTPRAKNLYLGDRCRRLEEPYA